MNRNDLINRLVARKMTTNASAKTGCGPCFGGPVKAFCVCMSTPTQKYCLAATKPAVTVQPKN